VIFLINSTLILVDVVLTDLVRSKWPNIEEIFCVQSLKSRTIFNYHSPQRTHWISKKFLLRDKRGKSRRARRAYCAHLVSQSKHDSLQLAHVRTRSRLSDKGTYPHWRVCGEDRCLMTQKLGWFYLVPMRHYFTYANRKERLRRSKYILLNSTGSNTLLIMSPTQQAPCWTWSRVFMDGKSSKRSFRSQSF